LSARAGEIDGAFAIHSRRLRNIAGIERGGRNDADAIMFPSRFVIVIVVHV
jgi:hypothetical protein